MPEPFTMIVLAAKWLATHTAVAHAAGVHAATAHATAGHAATVHAAAGHAGLTTTVLGTPIAASTVGGVTFLNVYKRVVDDVYDEVVRAVGGLSLHLKICARSVAWPTK